MVVAATLCALHVLADVPVPSFDRYQVILDRKPFGDLPPPPANTAPPGPPPVSFAQSLRLCTIIEEDDGGAMRVGFIDTRSNKSYLLAAGESEDGIEMVSASFADEEAVLRQGSETVAIKLQSGEVRAINPGDPNAAIQNSAPAAGSPPRPSYAERRRMRQVNSDVEPPVQPKYTGEELAKHLHDYQMEVIRQGLPPLPIPLTPEQDAQLVKEGLLPPAQ